MVAARIAFDGTHTGAFQGIPASNKRVAFSSIEINRLADGKVAEHWVELDLLELLQQVGAAPSE
jgi:predicted ester cyclase